jgi:hypothetical protein
MSGVVVKHPHRFERILAEILADGLELAEHAVGRGDDMAAHIISLEDIQQLARTGPNQFGARHPNVPSGGPTPSRTRVSC